MDKVTLWNIKDYTFTRRINAAKDLWVANQNAPQLKRELPYPAEGYKNPLKAYLRLRRIGMTAAQHDLTAFTIREGQTAIGMATSQRHLLDPDLIGVEEGVEISYWHKQMETVAKAVSVGKVVVGKLVQLGGDPLVGPDVALWMVTLPDDNTKGTVCMDAGMKPVEESQRYDIEDGVTEPRQLWVLKISQE